VIAYGSESKPLRVREHVVECLACDGCGFDENKPLPHTLHGRLDSEQYYEECAECDGAGEAECLDPGCDCTVACEVCGSREVLVEILSGRVTCRDVSCFWPNDQPLPEQERRYIKQEWSA
jgi:hypothetical protein